MSVEAVNEIAQGRVWSGTDAKKIGLIDEIGGLEAAIEYAAETVGSEYRYMQAQVAEGICLTCHGTDLPAAAVSTLSSYYPDDAATGYSAGQVRGAISLRRPLAKQAVPGG